MTGLRVGIVGVGARASIGRWVGSSDATIVAIADPRPAAATRAHELFGDDVIVLESYRDLPAHSLDAAIVTVPDDAHADVAEFLLRRGIAVYLEKPLATSIPDADRILNAAMESGSRLYIGHNMRHMRVVRMLRDIIARGEIGTARTRHRSM